MSPTSYQLLYPAVFSSAKVQTIFIIPNHKLTFDEYYIDESFV